MNESMFVTVFDFTTTHVCSSQKKTFRRRHISSSFSFRKRFFTLLNKNICEDLTDEPHD